MKKLVQVHRLPTEDKGAPLMYRTPRNTLLESRLWKYSIHSKYQHLYFTSDEEIVKGKEVYYIDKFTGKVTSSGGASYVGKESVIIATTNKSLTFHDKIPIGENINGLHKQLPQISQSFIEEYVKAGGIDEVLLEYKDWCDYDDDNTWGGLDKADLRLVLDQNNCVITHPVKPKLYTKEELIGNQKGGLDEFLLNSAKFSQEEREVVMDAVCDWIKKNLK